MGDDAADRVGDWSVGDHEHPFWRNLAQQVHEASNLTGEFSALERVESQVTAGFNARFTITSKDGVRTVLFSAHGVEAEPLWAPTVESVVAV